MIDKLLIPADTIPDYLLSSLEARDVALWLHRIPEEPGSSLVKFLGLPWRLVISEWYDPVTIQNLQAESNLDDPMTRRRGFIQVIDTEPSRIDLPQRCLPLYLLNGRHQSTGVGDFAARLRRLTMLEELRRSGVRNLLVLSEGPNPIPSDLTDLWTSGFRVQVAFATADSSAAATIKAWLDHADGMVTATHVRLDALSLADEAYSRFSNVYPDKRQIIRVRDRQGSVRSVDITEADEPERPILDSYSLIEERHLLPTTGQDLSEQDFIDFFKDPTLSWRPYAAGLPWFRNQDSQSQLNRYLKRLDSLGADENCVAYIASESGAGGTTLARAMAWEVARQGYPVLIARPVPFIPDALPLTNYLKRAYDAVDRPLDTAEPQEDPTRDPSSSRGGRYETPWLLVFDGVHWQGRDSELARFRNEMQKAGRPVCILVVTSPVLGLSFYNGAVFKQVAELNHTIDHDEALRLGRHLDKFLRVHGKQRTASQWTSFYEQHTVRHLEGLAAFWVTLSFWIQGQYDLSESIQEWMYRSFLSTTQDPTIQSAVLEIAALSSERLPLPESLLPQPTGQWPVSQLLEDLRSELSSLGLVRISADGEKHWALVHDILGRFLINALFHDFPRRGALGFSEARDAEHLRFLLLRKISQKSALGEKHYRAIGEDFATTIFKIDPDHGHAGFAEMWREVLSTLDAMPRSLRDTSRVFRHHTAVSRRRIARFDETFYGVSALDRKALLTRAIEDITYALTMIEYTAGSEANLNLYNSLANAYLDLAKVEASAGASRERLAELRRLANEATRKAYEESPTNSFVIETYVKNLLQQAEESTEHAAELCVEALGIVLAVLGSPEARYRSAQLGALADSALTTLFRNAPPRSEKDPRNAVDVLVQAWSALAVDHQQNRLEDGLSNVPAANIADALGVLDHPAGRGNMQVLRLKFILISLDKPFDFTAQLQLVEQLRATDPRLAPQLRLEYAILLFQAGRASEGEKEFRSLRQLWRDSEHFVQVPERLRWLRAAGGQTLQSVNAFSGSDYGSRAMARVQQFGNALVPFRPEEHGIREIRPGMRFVCHVSFGHNGPFLRPVTAAPVKSVG